LSRNHDEGPCRAIYAGASRSPQVGKKHWRDVTTGKQCRPVGAKSSGEITSASIGVQEYSMELFNENPDQAMLDQLRPDHEIGTAGMGRMCACKQGTQPPLLDN
jgi:hypothetical protein